MCVWVWGGAGGLLLTPEVRAPGSHACRMVLLMLRAAQQPAFSL